MDARRIPNAVPVDPLDGRATAERSRQPLPRGPRGEVQDARHPKEASAARERRGQRLHQDPVLSLV